MKLRNLTTTLGLGAGLMYLYDPERGRRRRAVLRDQVTGTLSDIDDGVSKGLRDLQNWSMGMAAEARSMFSRGQVSDQVLERRVKSRIGWSISHPASIDVTAHQSEVTLRGPILVHEVDDLLARVRGIPGVQGVKNELEVHERPGDIPGLQGDIQARRERIRQARENWPPRWRLVGGVVGGTLLLSGLIRGGLMGAVRGLVGLGLLGRSVANEPIGRLVGLDMTRGAIDVQKSINIHATVDEVFQFWREFENLPRVMPSVQRVRDLGNGRYHWEVEGPGGVTVEWDAHLTNLEPNREIAWTSEPGSMVYHSGMVHFSPTSDNTTRIDVHLSYTPPAGALGHAVATVFGSNPKQQLDEALVRLKSLIEEGKTTVRGETVTPREVKRSS
jgi:uncharacterized membrane protein